MKGYRTYIVAGLIALSGVLATTDWVSFMANPQAGATALVCAIMMALMRSITSTPPGANTTTNSFTFLAIPVALAVMMGLGGCQNTLNKIDAKLSVAVAQAKTLSSIAVKIGTIIYIAECKTGDLPSAAGGSVSKFVNFVSPNSTAAANVSKAVSINNEVVQDFCPVAAAITATIGSVSQDRAPSATIPAGPAS